MGARSGVRKRKKSSADNENSVSVKSRGTKRRTRGMKDGLNKMK